MPAAGAVPRRIVRGFVRLTLLPVVAVLAACSATDRGKAATELPLRVMTFNIEWGGTHVDFGQVVAAIRAANPDVVGIQEAEANLDRLATELGWHANRRAYVISRFPIVEPPDAEGRYVLVEIAAGRVVAVANLHLPSDPYGPDAVRDGASRDEVLGLERRTRLPAIRPLLPVVSALAARQVPVFITGDFNTPSHADWVPRAVGTRPFLRYALDWPVTRAVSAAGFSDAWRSVYPDPVAHPGLTWWARRPPLALYAPGENDAEDRIDYIWFGGPVRVSDAGLVGEAGRPDVAIGLDPWPSDHRAVVADFDVTPAPMPALAVPERHVYRQGDSVTVFHHVEAGSRRRVVVWRDDDRRPLAFDSTVSRSGRIELGAGLLAPGRYAVAFADEIDRPPRHSRFWVLAAAAEPSVTIGSERFASGESILAAWQDGPGNRNDYLAIYAEGAPPDSGNIAAWTYVDALPEGRVSLDGQTLTGTWPLAPGRYRLRLMEDDGTRILAESAAFAVVAR